MNQTSINSELLAESRGRKHIPLAVFAVIMIHVVLFVVLLVAAGCRSKARARQQAAPEPQAAATVETNAPAETISQLAPNETVIAEEPRTDDTPAPGPRQTVQRASPSRPRAEAAVATTGMRVRTYVVRPGDTVGKIAKDHGISAKTLREENQIKGDMIRVGQKLRVTVSPKLAAI